MEAGEAEEPEIKLPTSTGSSKKQESSRKTSISALLNMPKPCVDHNKLWTILQEMGISDHQTCLLKNLYAGQEATVRTGHGTTDWFQIGKGVCQGCILGYRQGPMKRQVQRSAENCVEAMEDLTDKGLKDTTWEDVSVTCSCLVGVDSILEAPVPSAYSSQQGTLWTPHPCQAMYGPEKPCVLYLPSSIHTEKAFHSRGVCREK